MIPFHGRGNRGVKKLATCRSSQSAIQGWGQQRRPPRAQARGPAAGGQPNPEVKVRSPHALRAAPPAAPAAASRRPGARGPRGAGRGGGGGRNRGEAGAPGQLPRVRRRASQSPPSARPRAAGWSRSRARRPVPAQGGRCSRCRRLGTRRHRRIVPPRRAPPTRGNVTALRPRGRPERPRSAPGEPGGRAATRRSRGAAQVGEAGAGGRPGGAARGGHLRESSWRSRLLSQPPWSRRVWGGRGRFIRGVPACFCSC